MRKETGKLSELWPGPDEAGRVVSKEFKPARMLSQARRQLQVER